MRSLRFQGLLTALISAGVRLLAAGWFAFSAWPLYLVLLIFHSSVHFRELRQPVSKAQVGVAVASNFFLFIAFGMQFDAGDAPGQFTALGEIFSALTGIDMVANLNETSILWIDALLLVPVIATWPILVLMAKRKRRIGGS